METIPGRFIWAHGLLNVKPEQHILEIGCGAGLMAVPIAAQLKKGTYTGLDQSKAMLAKAQKRHALVMENGKVSFIASALKAAGLPPAHYDIIIAFNLPFVWKNSPAEFEKIKQALKPEGKFFVFYQAPYDITRDAALPVKNILLQNGFAISKVHFQKLNPVSAFGIEATVA